MDWLRGAWVRVRSTVRRSAAEQDMDEELEFHLEMETEKYIRAGVPPGEARRRARIAFGGVEKHREDIRVGRRIPVLETLLLDLRYGVRSLWRSPAILLVALASLGIGIGGNVAIFSLVDAVALRPLPGVARPEELVSIPEMLSYPAYRDLAEASPALVGLAAYAPRRLRVEGAHGPVHVEAEAVSADFFDVLGVRPSVGRAFVPEDDQPGASPVAVLSYAYWQSSMGGNEDVIGSTLRVNGTAVSVIGVAPPRFRGPLVTGTPGFWLPLRAWKNLAGPTYDALTLDDRGWNWLMTVGRLAPGVPLEMVERDLSASAALQVQDFPGESGEPSRVRLLPATAGDSSLGRAAALRPFAWALMGIVGIALLLVCANLSALMLARTETRRREMAIRAALGAGTSRLAKQLLVENVLLATGGAVLGLLVAAWSIALIQRVELPGEISLTGLDLRLDMPVVGFAIGIAAVTLLSFGTLPVLRGARPSVPSALGSRTAEGGRRGGWNRGVLLGVQVALCAVLLAIGGLFLHSLRDAYATDLGYDAEQVGYVTFVLGGAEGENGLGIAEEIERRVAETAGVTGVSWTSTMPMSGGGDMMVYQIDGRQYATDDRRMVGFTAVTPNYFRTLRIPILSGRDIESARQPDGSRELVVSKSFAAREWPGQNPLGAVVRVGPFRFKIVGVAGDTRMRSVNDPPVPFAYGSIDPRMSTAATTLIFASENPERVLSEIQRIIAEIDPNAAVESASTLGQQLNIALAPQRTIAFASGLFGILALLLACAGVYGVVAYTVSVRTRELGIRAALGGRTRNLVASVLRPIMFWVGIGLSVGLGLALLAAHLVRSLLLGVSPTAPIPLAAAAVLLFGAATVAGYLPSYRAARVDPASALRSE